MNKLVQYAKEEGYTQIKVQPNPNADNFKKDKKENALKKDDLISFYKKFGCIIISPSLLRRAFFIFMMNTSNANCSNQLLHLRGEGQFC